MNKKVQIKATIEKFGERPFVGYITVDEETRLSDFILKPTRFIVIKDSDNKIRIINKDYIAEISPLD